MHVEIILNLRKFHSELEYDRHLRQGYLYNIYEIYN